MKTLPWILLAFLACVPVAGVSSSSIPAGTYGRMTISASLADGGGAIAVPATCMSPRAYEEVFNYDSQPVCCGFDQFVTCIGPKGGVLVPPVDGGVPGYRKFEIGCDGVKGVIFCSSDAGSAANSFGWDEVR